MWTVLIAPRMNDGQEVVQRFERLPPGLQQQVAIGDEHDVALGEALGGIEPRRRPRSCAGVLCAW